MNSSDVASNLLASALPEMESLWWWTDGPVTATLTARSRPCR